MRLIPDDPIIASAERTGYPWWWHQPDYPDSLYDDDEEYEEEDVYYGNETSSF